MIRKGEKDSGSAQPYFWEAHWIGHYLKKNKNKNPTSPCLLSLSGAQQVLKDLVTVETICPSCRVATSPGYLGEYG